MNHKTFLALIILGIILISGCVQKFSEPKIMQSEFQYDTTIEKIEFDTANVFEKSKNNNYIIRILKTPKICKNPDEHTCSYKNEIPAEYEYINIDQKNFSTIEEAFPKYFKSISLNGTGLRIDEEDIHISVSTIDYQWRILTSTHNKWMIIVVPNKKIQTTDIKQSINQELKNLGISSKNINFVFREYTPNQLH